MVPESNDLQATKAIAEFTSGLRPHDLSTNVKSRLKELLLDYIGVASAACIGADSTEAIIKGVSTFTGEAESGPNTVFKHGQRFSPQIAALLNGTLSHSFDFDDTFARGCLHPGAAIISAAVAQAEFQNSSPDRILTALAAGYEVVCRIAIQLSDGSYERGFHNTATAGIFGCVAAISSLRGLCSRTIEMAFGLAGSKAAGSMQFLENGSWNKRLHPGFAAHDAFLCVHLAEAGVHGAEKCFEGRFGVFHAYSSKPSNLKALTKNLGLEWDFIGTALKPFPACRMTHGAMDLASAMAASTDREGVESITVAIRPACVEIVGTRMPNKVHPQNIVDAQFSMYFQVAAAWLYGCDAGWAVYKKLDDPKINDLTERINVVGDEDIDGLETKLTAKWANGSEKSDRLFRPLGEESNPFTKDRIDQKFFSLTRPVYGQKIAAEIKELVDDLENHSIAELMRLVR